MISATVAWIAHGRARDVYAFHFTSEDNADLKFLSKVLLKVERIRMDLRAVGAVFDAVFGRRFQGERDADNVGRMLDADIAKKAAQSSNWCGCFATKIGWPAGMKAVGWPYLC